MVPPAELPFYKEEEKVEYKLVPREPTVLEGGVRAVREGAGLVVDQARLLVEEVNKVVEQVNHVVETGKAHTQGAYNQLLDEDALPARVGVIAATGAAGLLVGVLRGRLVKRVLYTGLGAGLGAALCYPEEARQAGEVVETEGRKLVDMATELVNGGSLKPLSTPSADMSLVASSISRTLRFLAKQSKELYTVVGGYMGYMLQLQGQPSPAVAAQAEVPQVAVVTEVEASKGAEVVFLAPSPRVEGVQGDPGMGREEDKDLYTTRGN